MYRTFILLATLFLLSCGEEVSGSDKYRLVWSDEFNGPAIDTTSWNFMHGWAWNDEDQYYTSDAANAYIKDGHLVIEARRVHQPNPQYKPGTDDNSTRREYISYTSARLNTEGKHEFVYGRFEMRAKLPLGGGAWPAFWTLGTGRDWPDNGEIDIMEMYRVNGENAIHANVGWGSDKALNPVWDAQSMPISHFMVDDPAWGEKFHVWRMDWTEQYIRLYVDDTLMNETLLRQTVNAERGGNINPFRGLPQYILLNLAIGGNCGGQIDDSAFPMRYVIDYVRVYQKKDKGNNIQ